MHKSWIAVLVLALSTFVADAQQVPYGFFRTPIDPNWSMVTLNLQMDGVDASTSFPDRSSSAHVITVGADAQIDTAQSKFGGASALFDGTGDYLSLDGGAALTFGTGAFTIELWFRQNVANVACCMDLYDSRPALTAGAYPLIRITAANCLQYRVGTTNAITDVSALTAGVWYHVAVSRSGTSTRMFLNGVQVGTTWTDSTNYLNPTSRPFFGNSGYNFPGYANGFNGWIDSVRVTKGFARYTSGFTPPTRPFPNH